MKTTPSSTRPDEIAQIFHRDSEPPDMYGVELFGEVLEKRFRKDGAIKYADELRQKHAPLYEQKEELVRVVQLAANLMNSQHAGCSERMTCTNHRSCELLREAERLLAEIRGGA